MKKSWFRRVKQRLRSLRKRGKQETSTKVVHRSELPVVEATAQQSVIDSSKQNRKPVSEPETCDQKSDVPFDYSEWIEQRRKSFHPYRTQRSTFQPQILPESTRSPQNEPANDKKHYGDVASPQDSRTMEKPSQSSKPMPIATGSWRTSLSPGSLAILGVSPINRAPVNPAPEDYISREDMVAMMGINQGYQLKKCRDCGGWLSYKYGETEEDEMCVCRNLRARNRWWSTNVNVEVLRKLSIDLFSYSGKKECLVLVNIYFLGMDSFDLLQNKRDQYWITKIPYIDMNYRPKHHHLSRKTKLVKTWFLSTSLCVMYQFGKAIMSPIPNPLATI